LDDHTLLLELEAPSGHSFQQITQNLPVPRHAVERGGDAWTDPGSIVSNGPFTLKSWQPEDRLVLERNPLYHGRFRGNLQQVELAVAPGGELPAAQEMYEADRVDVLALMTGMEPGAVRELDRIRQRHGADYVSLPEEVTYFLAFDVTRPPFTDRQVRRAFALALDRQVLADGVLGGYRQPATGGLVPRAMPGHCPGIALPCDPEQAAELLASTGYPSGAGFPEAELRHHAPARGVAEYLRSAWQEHLGVAVNLNLHEPAAKPVETRPHLSLTGWATAYDDPHGFLGVAVSLYTAWGSEPYLDLVERARCSTDPSERMALYAEAERLLVEEVPLLPLLYGQQHLLLKPWVRRYPLSVRGTPCWKDVILEPH
jgi:oligopeptide transport system substrate-binding protein